MDSLSDNALMLKVKSGDIQRLGLLYERYKKRLFGFFYQMGHDANLSEDLVQNVFIKVLKYRHTYTDQSTFISWLFKIARNTGYDHFNNNKKSQGKLDITKVSHKISDHTIIDEQIILEENKTTLARALQLLPTEKREVLILSKLKELKYREVGNIIGCSEGAARTKVHRALSDLKDVFFKLEKR